MEGRIQLQFFDKETGKCTYDSGVKKNVITTLYKDVIDTLYITTLSNPHFWRLSKKATQVKPFDLSNGIMILESPQIESSDTLTPTGNIIGYAGDETVAEDTKRGVLNTSESGAISGGYKWVWEWSSNKANGLISAVGLCPKAIGNGNLFAFDPLKLGLMLDGHRDTNSVPDTGKSIFMENGDIYKQYKFGYIKNTYSPIKYKQSVSNSRTETTYKLPEPWDFCSRPNLYKGKIWLCAFNQTEQRTYLLKLTKDTNTIEQSWIMPDGVYGVPIAVDNFGLTDTKVIFLVETGTSTYKLREFSITGTFLREKNLSEIFSSSLHSSISKAWFSSSDYVILMFGEGTSPLNLEGGKILITGADGVISDCITYSGPNMATMPIGSKPFGYSYYSRYFYGGHLNFWKSLFSVKNLDVPQTKDDSKSMKVTYTITE